MFLAVPRTDGRMWVSGVPGSCPAPRREEFLSGFGEVKQVLCLCPYPCILGLAWPGGDAQGGEAGGICAQGFGPALGFGCQLHLF